MERDEMVAMAIYHASFDPKDDDELRRRKPSPGWCWKRTSEQMREFARKQARAAIAAYEATP